MQPDFLEPLMNTVMPELMLAIWKHLRPSPYIYGPVALRILGKLGGRNRNCIRSPLELTCKENPENGLRLVLTFEPGIHFMLPVDEYHGTCPSPRRSSTRARRSSTRRRRSTCCAPASRPCST